MNGGGAEHPRSEGWSFPCLFCGTQVMNEKLDQMTQEAFNPDLKDEGRQELKLKITEVTQKLQTISRKVLCLNS